LSKLEGYQEVADRIAVFYEKYPEGSIRTKGFNVIEVAGQTFIVVEALVYRNTTDQLPGTGTAWEPFPGRTAYTRGSELMVGETSAWGRALASIGLGGRKIATAEEVQAAVEVKASDRGLKLQAELKKRKVTQDKIKLAMAACGVDVGGRSLPVVFKGLTDEEVNTLWHRLISE
jgi:hypothetical protein